MPAILRYNAILAFDTNLDHQQDAGYDIFTDLCVTSDALLANNAAAWQMVSLARQPNHHLHVAAREQKYDGTNITGFENRAHLPIGGCTLRRASVAGDKAARVAAYPQRNGDCNRRMALSKAALTSRERHIADPSTHIHLQTLS